MQVHGSWATARRRERVSADDAARRRDRCVDASTRAAPPAYQRSPPPDAVHVHRRVQHSNAHHVLPCLAKPGHRVGRARPPWRYGDPMSMSMSVSMPPPTHARPRPRPTYLPTSLRGRRGAASQSSRAGAGRRPGRAPRSVLPANRSRARARLLWAPRPNPALLLPFAGAGTSVVCVCACA